MSLNMARLFVCFLFFWFFFPNALPLYLSYETERAYKKYLSIISVDQSYKLKLERFIYPPYVPAQRTMQKRV